MVAAAGFATWKYALQKNPPCEVYETLAYGTLFGAHSTALSCAEGPEIEQLFKSKRSRVPFTPLLMEAFHGAKYEYESLRKGNEVVDLDVLQSVVHEPPGVHSALGGTMVRASFPSFLEPRPG